MNNLDSKAPVAVICGAPSVEHEISIVSAAFVVKMLQQAGFETDVIVVSKTGEWLRILDLTAFLTNELTNLDQQLSTLNGTQITPVFGMMDRHWQAVNDDSQSGSWSCVMSMIHGHYGEDGALAGMLQFLDVPFVGPTTQTASTTYDKDLTKQLLQQAGLPVVPWCTLQSNMSDQAMQTTVKAFSDEYGWPLYIKPARGGSSIGVEKVMDWQACELALNQAFCLDDKVLVETAIEGRELEFAVIKINKTIIAGPGELIVKGGFYGYAAKYLDADSTKALLSPCCDETIKQVMRTAIEQAVDVLGIQSMMRMDFFLDEQNEFYINEINAIPGCTAISMFPKLFENEGVPASELFTMLITQAKEDYHHRNAMQQYNLTVQQALETYMSNSE